MGVKKKITMAKRQELQIQDAFDEYMEEKKALNKSPATINSANYSIGRWIKFLTDYNFSMDVKDIDITYLREFQFKGLGSSLAPASVNHYIRDIRAFIYWCIEQNYIANPFKIKQITAQQTIKETYTQEEQQKLTVKPTKYAGFVEWRSYAIVSWILATGHRAGTVIEIKLGDINYRKMEIAVRQTKNNIAMITPLSKTLSVVIKEYVRLWRYDASDDDYLFCNVGKEQLTVNALKHSIRDYNHSRGVDRTSVHAFRHTFAKEWIRNTGDVFRLQKLLGHKTLEMTRNYVNMFDEDLKEGFDEYNPLDKLKRGQARTQTVKRNET